MKHPLLLPGVILFTADKPISAHAGFHPQGWPAGYEWHTFSGILFLSIILVHCVLPSFKGCRKQTQRVLTSLIWVSLWQFGCTQTIRGQSPAPNQQPAPSAPVKCLPVVVIRTTPAGQPAGSVTSALPVPTFQPASGVVLFGDSVSVSVSGRPAGATTEYSTDGGKTWQSGSRIAVVNKNCLMARTRLNDSTSNIAQTTFTPAYRRVIVFGNSITNHPPAPDLGWFNNNGMAASAPDKDFVHLLTARLIGLNPATEVRLENCGDFERNFWTYDLDHLTASFDQFKPDLVLVRLGENVDEGFVQSHNFELHFRRLLERMASYHQPVKLVCSTSVWYQPQTDAVIRKVTTEKTIPLADLRDMVGQGRYFASQYANPAVAAHPNDAGMQRIADLLWEKIP